jgi:hypothetical protein
MFEPLYLYVGVQFVLFLLYKYCITSIENFQYYEMVFGSIFIILIFGYMGPYFVSINDMLGKSVYMSIFFSIWYYMTKLLTNTIMKDANGVIHWN